jgi:hypothetical protein
MFSFRIVNLLRGLVSKRGLTYATPQVPEEMGRILTVPGKSNFSAEAMISSALEPPSLRHKRMSNELPNALHD